MIGRTSEMGVCLCLSLRSEERLWVTTLLDPGAYPKAELEQLFGLRWQVELDLRHLKTTTNVEAEIDLSLLVMKNFPEHSTNTSWPEK